MIGILVAVGALFFSALGSVITKMVSSTTSIKIEGSILHIVNACFLIKVSKIFDKKDISAYIGISIFIIGAVSIVRHVGGGKG